MGKRLIIKGADFSENAVEKYYTPYVSANYTSDTMFSKGRYSFTDSTNELNGKTINGFEVKFTNDLPGNLTKTAIITIGEQVVNIACEFQEGDTVKVQKFMLDEPYTFGNHSVLYYEATGNATSSENRGGCNVLRRIRTTTGVPEYAFSVERMDTHSPIETMDCMPFTKLLLV